MTRLSAEAVSVRRGGRAVLDRVSARFEAGAFTAVVGPNGAGKSTLLAALAGLVAPDAGEVRLDGTLLGATPRRMLARRRAYLPQNPRAEWPIPVERLVALGLTPQLPPFGALPAAMAAQVEAALAACDLADRRDQPATTLSGGELARAMLARALVGDPEILIVDEPTAGLDPRHALAAMARLQGLSRAGKLVVAAVHDLTLVARYADAVLALREGRLLAHGAVAEALTGEMLQRLFDVEASVAGVGETARVDFLGGRATP